MNFFALILFFILITVLIIMYRVEFRKIFPSISFKHISFNSQKDSYKWFILVLFMLNFGLLSVSIAGTGYELSEDLIYYKEAEVFHSSQLLLYRNAILPSSSIILIVKGYSDYSWYDPVEIESGFMLFASIKTLDQIFRDGQRVRFSGFSTGKFSTIGYGEPIEQIKLTYISAIDKPQIFDWFLVISLIAIPINLSFFILKARIHSRLYRILIFE
ncbi:MAG: hypothetical protein ACFFAU_04830 [Candidatus Hodarchaeota archaeon]